MARSTRRPAGERRRAARRWAGSFVVRLGALAMVVVVPLVLVAVAQARSAQDHARRAVQERALAVAQSASAAHAAHVRTRQVLLERVAEAPELQAATAGDEPATRARCDDELDAAQRATGSTGLVAVSATGEVLCSTSTAGSQTTRLVALAGDALVASGGVVAGPYVQDGQLRLALATPVGPPDAGGASMAVASALDVSWLDHIGPAAAADEGDLVVLVGPRGELLGASGLALPADEIGRPTDGAPDLLAEFPTLRPGAPVVGEVTAPERRLFAAVALDPDVGDAYVTVSHPASAVEGPLAAEWADRRTVIAASVLLAVVLGGVAGWWWFVRPVRRLVASTERIGRGDDEARVDLRRWGGELDRLGTAVDDMATRLRERANQLAFQGRLLAAANDAVLAIDADERVVAWNGGAERLLGWSADETVGRRIGELPDDPAHRSEVQRLVRRIQATGGFTGEEVVPRRDGQRVPVFVSASVVADEVDGDPVGAIAVLVDVSARRAAEEEAARRASHQQAVGRVGERALHAASPDEVVAAAVDEIEQEIPGAVAQVHLDGHLAPALPAADAPGVDEGVVVREPITGAARRHGELVVRGARGTDPVDRSLLHSVAQLVAVALDRADADQELRRLALHDDLTGLPNRRLLVDRIERCVHRARRGGDPFAVLFLDLDRFKVVNDGLGHLAGDGLLVEVARRLRAAGRDQDTVARLGGDEFAVLCEDLADPPIEAARIAERINSVLRTPIVVGDEQAVTTASIGVAIGGAGSGNAESVLREADVALYRAKERGRDRYAIFNEEMQAGVTDRLARINELREAIAAGQFEVRYQPEVALDGDAVWVEALVRWNHPVRGLLPPAEFVALAEETGLIVDLGAWVLDEACAQLVRWCDEDPASAPGCVSVNLSPRQLVHPGLVGHVRATLERTGLDPELLFFELTESAIADDPEHAREVLEELKGLGVGLAIDDFGTGYSSLAHLRRFPVDALKIDRAFVAGLPDRGDGSVIEAVVALAGSLDLVTIAEGVETEEQADALARLGCDFAQGYLYARPLPAEEVPDLVGACRAAWRQRRVAVGSGAIVRLDRRARRSTTPVRRPPG